MVGRILQGGRPTSRDDRISWIRDTAKAHEIEPFVAAYLKAQCGDRPLEELREAEIEALLGYVHQTVRIELRFRADRRAAD